MNLNDETRDTDIETESVEGFIGSKIRKIEGDIEVSKEWVKDKNKANSFVSDDITDEEYEKLKEAFEILSTTENVSKYKKSYDYVCRFCSFKSEQTVIKKHILTKGKTDHNHLCVTISANAKKIVIPNGDKLYHISSSKFSNLKPSLRNKSSSKKSYWYSSPRVYFTVKKNMNLYFADIYSKKDVKYYTPDMLIRTAYIDPLLSLYSQGAVYIETNSSIPVHELTSKDLAAKESTEFEDVFFNTEEASSDDEDISFDTLDEFMEYYGLTYADDDEVIEEGFINDIKKNVQSFKDLEEYKKEWKEKSSSYKFKNNWKKVDQKGLEKIKKLKQELIDAKDYLPYKKAYNEICKFFGIKPDQIVINKIEIGKTGEDDKTDVNLISCEGRKKIIIPAETQLIHRSPVDNITELKPSFKSRTAGMYLYPCKRVYFTLRKSIPGSKFGVNDGSKLTSYTPKEKIKMAYIDPGCSQFNFRAVYVDTAFPIPVEKIEISKNEKEWFT